MTEAMRWRMIAYMALLFLAGFITGAAVIARTAAGPQTLKVGRSNEITALIRQRLSVLDLTPEQRARFDPLIQKASEDLETSHLQCLQRCFTTVANLHAQIRPELNTAQQEKLKQLDEERHSVMIKKYNYNIETAEAAHP